MNVTATINGHITAKTSALYSLHFARVHGFSLTLLHILNPDDRIETVEESMTNIEKVANKYNMATERVILQGQPTETLERYLVEKRSTMKLPVDMALARVVRPHSTIATTSIVLPIKQERLSVEKFTFFSSMAKAYKASGEIYSVTVAGKKKRATQPCKNSF